MLFPFYNKLPNRIHHCKVTKKLQTIARYQNSIPAIELSKESNNSSPQKRVQSAGSNVTSEESSSPPRSRGKKRRRNHASSFREFISNRRRHLWIALTRGWNPCGWNQFHGTRAILLSPTFTPTGLKFRFAHGSSMRPSALPL